jgi:ATP-dependent Clp protease ATP-binding subunit ClpA
VGSDKIEKRLPDDIISLIDQEASSSGISRQDVVSRLITAVKEANLAEENKELKRENEYLHKQQKDNQSEIQYLRDEISKFSSGLTSLAVTLGEGRVHEVQKSTVDSLSNQIRELSEDINHIKENSHDEERSVMEKNLPLIMVSILAGLLLIYLIISKIM